MNQKQETTINGITFKWQGGPYIDVGEYTEIDSQGYRCCFKAYEVINVWDYEKNQTTLTERHQFIKLCREWYNFYKNTLNEYRMSVGM